MNPIPRPSRAALYDVATGLSIAGRPRPHAADFAFSVVGGNNWNALFEKGMDLYAVRMASAAAVQLTDYYKGLYDGDASATGIEAHIVYEPLKLNQGAPGELGRHNTSAASEAALGAWLQSMYDSAAYNAAGTNYVYLRLSARDDLTSTYRYWSVATANNATVADRPLLTIDTIPEPATLPPARHRRPGLGSSQEVNRKIDTVDAPDHQ